MICRIALAILACLVSQISADQTGGVQELTGQIPACSDLRQRMASGDTGDGIDLPYMAKMRRLGIARAELEVRSELHGAKPTNIRSSTHLYFRQFDAPDSQITDEQELDALRTSGLEAILDDQAGKLVLAAPVSNGPDFHFTQRKGRWSKVEFLSTPWLRPPQVRLFPGSDSPLDKESALNQAANAGDIIAVKSSLASHKFTQKQLDRALLEAANSTYDNTTVIRMLVHAGANINGQYEESNQYTPLMNAVARPCNIQPLLSNGADLSLRNKWGKTALDIATDQKVKTTIEILEKAGR